MSQTFDTEIDFYLGGVKVGGSCVSVTGGKIDTSAAEEEFYAVLRKNENSIIEEGREHQKSWIVDHLTDTDEDKLKEVHTAQYHGTDDDAPDDYEDWLTELDVDELIKIIDWADLV